MSMLKWSRFNFLTEVHGTSYLYNAYTNGLIKLNNSLFQDLAKLAEKENLSESDLSQFSDEELSYFKDSHILVHSDEELVEVMHHQSLSRLYSRKHIVLTIAPTQSCNFSCTYCFEKWRKSGTITDETEDAIIGYLSKQVEQHGLESISLTWYGGEPLLQPKRIISLAKRINKLGLAMHENTLITNGYYFTPDIVEKLVEVGVSTVQVTLDGFKEVHDLRRPLTNGKGTFDTILKNLDDYHSSPYRDAFDIAIRVNIDKQNYKSFVDLHSWLKDRYKSKKVHVYPGIVVLDEENSNHSTCFSRNQATDVIHKLHKEYGIKAESLYPDDINMECMARSPYSMLIGCQGEIYKCYEDLGDNNLTAGNINNPEVWTNESLLAKYAVGIDHYQDPECRACSYLPICHGGCPIRRLENKYMNKANDCCTPFKGRINDYLELYLKK